jgi:hypothetical protein
LSNKEIAQALFVTVKAVDFHLTSVYRGTVALAEIRTRWTSPRGQVSRDEGELGEGVGKAGSRRNAGAEIVEAPAEVLDEGMTGDDDPGGAVSLQPAHRAKSCLQPPMVGLERVVGMDLRAVEGRWEHLIEDSSLVDKNSLNALDGDHDLSSGVSLFQMTDGLGDLTERIRRVDDRRDLAALDQVLEHDQVLALRLRDERAQLLAHER